MSLDTEFQVWIEVYGFCKAGNYFVDWIDQVKLINTYWDKLIDEIDREYFTLGFVKTCTDSNIPVGDFDFNSAFEKCKTEWRTELMTLVADRIVKWSFLTAREDTTCVKWSGQEMILELNLR